jgi:hypothetical protein
VTEQRAALVSAIMDEALAYLEVAEQLQYAAHLLREHADFNEENDVIPRGRRPRKGGY